MSKITKILFLFVILLSLIFNFAYATTEDVVETQEDATATISSDSQDSDSEDIANAQSSFSQNYSGVTSVSQLSNYSEANLGLNNILNIILIAIGVLIILFAIAILIRLKQ